MTNYEAIKNLTLEQLERFLDQVFLTGFNKGYWSLVNPTILDDNRFDADWLNADVEGCSALVESKEGEELLIEPLAKVINDIIEFDESAIPREIDWNMQVVLPEGIEDNENE